jgi:nucleotide-binding universal stress UspA family protein
MSQAGAKPPDTSPFDDLPVTVVQRHGEPLDELLSYAAEIHADLLLVGHQRTGSKQRILARRLAMKAPCSVWMVPEDAPPSISNILVPVDFSARSADALRTAAAIAASRRLTFLTAIHVYFDEAVATYEGHQNVMRMKEELNFETFLSRIDLDDIEVRTHWEESSHVSDTILRIASETSADLIVMGTRGRSRSAGILLGSETDRVLAGASVPVLAIKRSGENLGFLEALLDRRFHRKDEAHFG